jgi:hypothetical protein
MAKYVSNVRGARPSKHFAPTVELRLLVASFVELGHDLRRRALGVFCHLTAALTATALSVIRA